MEATTLQIFETMLRIQIHIIRIYRFFLSGKKWKIVLVTIKLKKTLNGVVKILLGEASLHLQWKTI
jgi:hypothetical protein